MVASKTKVSAWVYTRTGGSQTAVWTGLCARFPMNMTRFWRRKAPTCPRERTAEGNISLFAVHGNLKGKGLCDSADDRAGRHGFQDLALIVPGDEVSVSGHFELCPDCA